MFSGNEKGYDESNRPKRTTEDKFINALKKKDISAYEKLYDEYSGIVGGIARSYLNADDVEDVIQEVFLRVFKSVKRFKGDSAFSTWLYRIAVNVCKDFLKRYSKRSETIVDFEDEEIPFQEPVSEENIEQKIASEYEMESFEEILGKLSEEDRLFITLRDIENLDYEEISGIVGKPLGTVKSRIHYARKKLRNLLQKYGID